MKPDAPAPPALGIDLGGTKIEARLFDDARRELWRERIAKPQGVADWSAGNTCRCWQKE